jgi:hypothetical protein
MADGEVYISRSTRGKLCMKTRRTLYSRYTGSPPFVAFKYGRKTGGKDEKLIPGDYIGEGSEIWRRCNGGAGVDPRELSRSAWLIRGRERWQ